MSGFHTKKRSLLDNAFLAFEAVMHVYLTIYLISIDAALLAIGFTIFELTMFIRLLKKGVKPQDAYCDDICPWKNGEVNGRRT